jgi:XTP/dITP diphosphohydrolase
MKLVIATRNQDKLREIKELFLGAGLNDVSFFCPENFPGYPEVIEDGKTQRENALKKARVGRDFTGKVTLAEDSGLEIQVLGSAPGVYSARFAGKDCTYHDNNLKLLAMMEKFENRKAMFRCVAAIAFPDGDERVVEGTVDGHISRELLGEAGFGYDPLFIPSGYDKTFGQLGLEVKQKISHRTRAICAAIQVLKNI